MSLGVGVGRFPKPMPFLVSLPPVYRSGYELQHHTCLPAAVFLTMMVKGLHPLKL